MDKNSTISQVSLLHSNRNYDHKVQQTKQTQSGHMQNSRRLPRSTNSYFHPLVSVFIFQSKYKSYKFKKYSIEICWLTREVSKKKSNRDILNGSIGPLRLVNWYTCLQATLASTVPRQYSAMWNYLEQMKTNSKTKTKLEHLN